MLINEPQTVRVNGIAIPIDTINEHTQYHPAASQRDAMIQATESLVMNELVRQAALSEGISVSQELITAEEAYKYCLAILKKHDRFKEPTEEICRRFYAQNTSRFTTAPLMEVRHILLAAAPDELDRRSELKALAGEILTMLRNDISLFDQLVQTHSHCPTKDDKGMLGQVSAGQLVPEFERQVLSAPVGLMSRPIESRYGYHIVDVLQKVEGDVLPYEAVESRIQEYLSEQDLRFQVSNLLQQLIDEAKIEGFRFDSGDSPLVQ